MVCATATIQEITGTTESQIECKEGPEAYGLLDEGLGSKEYQARDATRTDGCSYKEG